MKALRETILRQLIFLENNDKNCEVKCFLMFISNQHANAVTDLFSKERKKK